MEPFLRNLGESPRLDADMARAHIDGFQTSYDDEIEDGWGYESVNAMVKYWPGGGPEEGGRDATAERYGNSRKTDGGPSKGYGVL